MANKTTCIALTHARAGVDLLPGTTTLPDAKEGRSLCDQLAVVFEGIAGGEILATVAVCLADTADVRASSTATLSGVVATDTLTINSVDFACVANGATGNQFNVGSDDAHSATNLAAAINGSTTAKIKGYVSASAAGAVVTVQANAPGVLGNCVTITQTGGHMTVTGSGFLASGAGRTMVATSYGLT